jgi:acyl-CoA synthetase (AMP-forming)/AMP-acid ligase II
MDSSPLDHDTFLNTFIGIARSADVDRNAVECGDERWTYGDLDNVSTGIALDLHEKYGSRPVVAIVSENHPYVLATILATWKLGGIVAPLDYNVPQDIMERMLSNIGPSVVVVPSSQGNVQKIVKGELLSSFLLQLVERSASRYLAFMSPIRPKGYHNHRLNAKVHRTIS